MPATLLAAIETPMHGLEGTRHVAAGRSGASRKDSPAGALPWRNKGDCTATAAGRGPEGSGHFAACLYTVAIGWLQFLRKPLWAGAAHGETPGRFAAAARSASL